SSTRPQPRRQGGSRPSAETSHERDRRVHRRDPRSPGPTGKGTRTNGGAVTTTISATEVVAANPGPAIHLAALGVVVLIGLITYLVVRWRRRRETAEIERQSDAHDASSADRLSETRRS